MNAFFRKPAVSVAILLCFLLFLVSPALAVSTQSKVKLNKNKATIYIGKTLQLKLTGTSSTVTWSSSRKSIATVDKNGLVTGKGVGTALITAKAGKKEYTCTVTVKESPVVMRPLSDHKEAIPNSLKLQSLSKTIYRIRNMNRLVNNSRNYSNKRMAERIQNFNRALDSIPDDIPVYLYFVENSRTHPIAASFAKDSDAYRYLKNNFHADYFDHLKYTTFKAFCSYFYTTDHHWNFRGSYQGYLDIVHMLKGADEKTLAPSRIVTIDAIFNGSYAENTKTAYSTEKFSFYYFESMPKYIAEVDGKKQKYDHIATYLRGAFSTQKYASHYHSCYGGNYGKAVFQNASPTGKGKLLTIVDSMSDPVLPLLIQHFDQIVSIDLRYYEEKTGKPFSLGEVIRDYDIDSVMFLGGEYVFSDGKLMIP